MFLLLATLRMRRLVTVTVAQCCRLRGSSAYTVTCTTYHDVQRCANLAAHVRESADARGHCVQGANFPFSGGFRAVNRFFPVSEAVSCFVLRPAAELQPQAAKCDCGGFSI